MEYKNVMDYNDYELLNYVADHNEEAHTIIFKKYKPLIITIATKMIKSCNGLGLDINDLIQEGMIGLSIAINSFEEHKDTLFYTYASKCIRRKMISLIVAASRQKHRFLNESIPIENSDDTGTLDYLLSDNTINPEKLIVNSETEGELLDKVKKILTDFEWQVFELKINGFNYHEIADMLDKDDKSIDNASQRIKNKINSKINVSDN
jgi:RNA polymerase sporulation-specific sigma factor